MRPPPGPGLDPTRRLGRTRAQAMVNTTVAETERVWLPGSTGVAAAWAAASAVEYRIGDSELVSVIDCTPPSSTPAPVASCAAWARARLVALTRAAARSLLSLSIENEMPCSRMLSPVLPAAASTIAPALLRSRIAGRHGVADLVAGHVALVVVDGLDGEVVGLDVRVGDAGVAQDREQLLGAVAHGAQRIRRARTASRDADGEVGDVRRASDLAGAGDGDRPVARRRARGGGREQRDHADGDGGDGREDDARHDEQTFRHGSSGSRLPDSTVGDPSWFPPTLTRRERRGVRVRSRRRHRPSRPSWRVVRGRRTPSTAARRPRCSRVSWNDSTWGPPPFPPGSRSN